MRKFVSLIIFNLCLFSIVFAQWQPANGPYGGGVHALTIDPVTNYIYAGTSGGVFQSTNNGNSWILLSNGLSNTYVQAIAINGNNFFAGTQNGLFLSTDGGNSWTPMNNGLSTNGMNIQTITISGNSVFIGTQDGGVFLSTDNGSSWTSINNGLIGEYIHVNAIAVSGNNIYAGTQDSGLFLSTDNGSSWTILNNGIPEVNIMSLVISGSNIFAGTDTGLFFSTDNGSSWTALEPAEPIYSLAINGNNVYVGANSGFFISDNNGVSWALANNGLYSTFVESIAISGNTLIIGTWNLGVYCSTDNGGHWIQSNNGISALNVLSLAIKGDSILTGTENQGLFISTDGDSIWSNSSFPNGSIRSITTRETDIIAGTFSGVFLSTDNGNSWTAMNNGLSNNFVNSIATSGSNIFAGTNDGVFLSTDVCNSWTKCNAILNNKSIKSIAVIGNNVFAASYGQGIFRSIDNGSNWITVNNGLTKKYVTSLAVSGNNLFAGTNGGVFSSFDNGNTWTMMNNGLTNKSVYSIAINGSNIFAGTYGGVFLSTNNGVTWKEVSTGLTTKKVSSLVIHGDTIFAGTLGGSVFKREISNIKDLSVSTNYITLNAQANQEIFSINSNTNVTISSSETWLTANISSGSGVDTITLTAIANPLSSPRSAKITVEGLGADSQTIIVTQFGQSIVSIPYNQDFSLWPLANWVFTGGAINWMKYNSNSAYVDFLSNKTSQNALLTMPTFDFRGLTELELKFKWSHKFYSSYPGELKVEVSTNGSTWATIWDKAANDLDSQDGAEDETPGTYATAIINLNDYAGLPSVNIRFNGISALGPNLFIDDVSIINSNVNSNFLVISPDTLSIGAQASSTGIFEIASNTNWTVSSDQSWLAVSDVSGFGNDSITLTAGANPATTARVANVTISAPSVSPRTIAVTQAGAVPVLIISKDTLNVSYQDNTMIFEITSNINWTISSDQNWLAVSDAFGSGNDTITLAVNSNPTIVTRVGIVTISGLGGTSKTITVTQAGAIPDLSISPNILSIAAPENSTSTFDIKSNIGWTVASNRNWLTVNNLNGSNNETITLTAKANHLAVNRIAIVTVSGIGVDPRVITVVQKGKKSLEELQSVTAYPNPTRGKFTLFLNNYDGEEVIIRVNYFMGNEITTIKLNNLPSSYNQEIDLSGLRYGFYFVTIQTAKTKVVKLINLTNH